MDRQIITPEKLYLGVFPEHDTKSYNTICKPFKDIFNDTIRLKALNEEQKQLPIFEHTYKVRVIEAAVGMWLSRVTQYILGDAQAAYDETFVGLVEPQIAQALQRHAIVGPGNQPNFPDIYQAGQVPAGYDPQDFNPDIIYPGQRFILIQPVDRIDFDSTVIKADISKWDNIWLGAVWGAQADLGIGGAHTTYGGVVSAADLFEHDQLRRFSGLSIHGWRLGLGAGVSSGATVAIFINYPSLESLNTYTNDGFSWDVAIGAKIPKGAPKAISQIFKALHSLKGVKKYTSLGKRGQLIKSSVEILITGLRAGLPKGQPYILTLPVPLTGPGLHLWLGFKVSQFETFLASEFGAAIK
jgi:hypothetical protein